VRAVRRLARLPIICRGVVLAALLPAGPGARADEWAARFRDPPAQVGMTAYWAWFGPAVSRDGIDRDLRNMHRAHVSGVTILPVYPLSADDPRRGVRNTPFLSPEFLALLHHAARRAAELGMTVDVTLGTGWPYGGPWITPDLAARRLQLRKAGAPLAPGDKVLATAGGDVFVSAPTRMQVKRAALGGEGLVLDHYNRAALHRHLEAAGVKLAAALKGTGVRAFWCDSLEVFDSNWTEDFPAEFRRRRGYDILPYLPLLFGGATPQARQVRRDYWRTLAELAEDEFFRPLQAWCHDRGVRLRAEPYGQPPVTLAACAHVDLPVGEHYEWRMLNATRWAASGGRLFGRDLIDAEAWTWAGIPNRFADSLEDLKRASDMHFVSGANSLMAVSYVHAPPGADPAYWVSYWGPWLNEAQPWWPHFPLLARYVQRVSWVLRQGRNVADVALYLPTDDVFAATPADRGLNLYFDVRERLHGGPIPEFGLKSAASGSTPVVATLLANGYAFDCVDSTTLPRARAGGGRLRMGHGDFGLVVLPGLVGMPLADLEQLAAFVSGGGSVIATRRLPKVAYGPSEDTPRLRRLVRQLFGPGRHGKGRAVLVADEGDAFAAALRDCLPPDLPLDRPDPDVAFVHRRLADGDIWFVANFAGEATVLTARFGGAGRGVEMWDPVTGDRGAGRDGHLPLNAFGSVVVRVTPRAAAGPAPAERLESNAVGIPGPWELAVPGEPPRTLPGPRGWTEFPGLQHFSGAGTYTTSLDLPGLAPGERLTLELGEVREVAEVVVNGHSAGVCWMRPHRLDITPHVRPGRNRIRVEVTNLLINRVLGGPPPDYAAVHRRFGPRFPDPVEWKQARPLPSGLLGPVRLLRTRPVHE
jgi:hypothetical protein